LVRKLMETKSKMSGIAAILDEWQRWSSKGPFLQSPPMSHQQIGPVNPDNARVRRWSENRRKPIKDGGRSSHLGWAAELTIESNLRLVTPNKPQKNRMNRPSRLSSNRRKPNPRWLP
jgi:hypothetical protein